MIDSVIVMIDLVIVMIDLVLLLKLPGSVAQQASYCGVLNVPAHLQHQQLYMCHG